MDRANMPLTPKQQAAIAGWRRELGRWRAAQLGLRGNKGGWIISTVNHRPIVQGYEGLYHKQYRLIWAAINQEDK